MSGPRPYETDPFHPPSSVHTVTTVSISIFMQKCSSLFCHVVLTLCLGALPFIIYACALPELVTPAIQSHFELILSSISGTGLGVLLRNTFANLHFLKEEIIN